MPADSAPARLEPVPVTVVLPARNAAATIDRQLEALARQDYTGAVELLVVDNGSEDSTAARALTWRDRIPGLRVIEARNGRSVSHARNAGFDAATNEFVCVCDADDIVDSSWVRLMVDALGTGDLVSGGTIDWDGCSLPAGAPDQFGSAGFGFLRSFGGCNFATRKTLWATIGGFDETLRSCEDIDFAWRAQLAGRLLVDQPDAFVYYRVPQELRAHFSRARHNATYQPALYAKFRTAGLRRQPIHRALANWVLLLLTSYRLLIGTQPEKAAWYHEAGRRCGRAIGSVRYRTLFL